MDNSLNLCAPVGKTGYGVTGFNIHRVLKDRGWDISLFGRGMNDRQSNLEQLELLKQSAMRSALFDYDAPCLNIWHQHDLVNRIGRGKYVAFPIFELDTFDEREKHHLGYPDELFVCSDWAKKVVLDNGISSEDRVHIVPLGS